LILLGYAANLDVKNLPLLICDLDHSPQSRELIAAFPNSGYFIIKDFIFDLRRIDHYLDHGECAMAVVIPPDFARKLTADECPQLQLIVDGSETNSATIGLNYASMIVSRYSHKIILQRIEKLKSSGLKPILVNPEVRVWYNPELKSRNFMVPGVLALLLMVVSLILTSLAIVKEKEIGTIEQLIVTPIKPYQLIIGKLTPFVMVSVVDIILVLSVSYFWFRVPIRGSVFLLLGLCLTFLLTTLGLGLFVSTVSKNQHQAMVTAVFFVMMPMVFLSGFVFPIENMPKIIQAVTYLLPLRYFFIIIRGLFLKGVGVVQLWNEALILLLYGLGILAVSILRFRKRL
jgi:ABC-2 type transport system permease protein